MSAVAAAAAVVPVLLRLFIVSHIRYLVAFHARTHYYGSFILSCHSSSTSPAHSRQKCMQMRKKGKDKRQNVAIFMHPFVSF